MDKRIELTENGLKCDNPKCNWSDGSILFKDIYKHINDECPKCGENVLTVEDYNRLTDFLRFVDEINNMPDELYNALAGDTEVDNKVSVTVDLYNGIKFIGHE